MNSSEKFKKSIILKEQNRHFAMNQQKKIEGFFKLDMACDMIGCTVIVLADNLKLFKDNEYVYQLLLAGTKSQNRFYHMLGDIPVDAKGHGEAAFMFKSQNLDSNGLCIWDLSSVIVAARSTNNNNEALHPVLKASISIPPLKELSQEKVENNNKAKSEEKLDYSKFYNRILLQRCIDLAKSQDMLVDVAPFQKNPYSIVWKRVDDFSRFPIISPGSEEQVKLHQHFLWGYNDTYYFLAVPGRFLRDEQPDKGRSGFSSWLPIAAMKALYDDETLDLDERKQRVYGYWLLGINRYSGNIEEIPLIG